MDFLLKDLALLQTGLEILLLILLVAVLWRTRNGPPGTAATPGTSEPQNTPILPVGPTVAPDKLNAAMERFLVESAKISKSFEANLADKKELSANLIVKLDRRLADYRELLIRTEAAIQEGEKRLAQLAAGVKTAPERDGPNPAAPETRALVLRLAKKGLSVEEIAERSRLLRGEVELIINLEKDFNV